VGRKLGRKGKQVHVLLAVVMLALAAACSQIAPQPAAPRDGSAHHALGRELFIRGEFEGALQENARAITIAGTGPVVEEALLYMGLISAHPANPKRDYVRASVYLKELAKGDPASPFVEQAKVMVSLLQHNEMLHRTVGRLNGAVETMKKAEIDKARTIQQKEELTRTIERLNGMIEALKKVDIGIEDKKREKVR
jgi:hypothetical protein